jgi:DNA-binding transcriptional LysR family regulator
MTSLLSLSQLRVFASVAKFSSFTRAADELRVSQPYVSGQISALEKRLDMPVFNRVGRKAYLNEAGKVIFPYVEAIMKNLTDAERSLHEFRQVIIGHVTIAASSTPGTYILPRILQQFLTNHPRVELSIQVKDTLQVEEILLKQQAELGVIASRPTAQALSAEMLCPDELLLVVGRDHRWAKASSVSVRDIEQERLILREHSSGTRIFIEEKLKAAGISPLAPVEFSNNDAIKEAVAAGLGVAFLSERTIRSDIALKRLVPVALDIPPLTRAIHLLTLRNSKLSPAASVLYTLIAEQLRSL